MRLPGFAIGLTPWLLYLVMPHDLVACGPAIAALTAAVVAAALTIWTRNDVGYNMLTATAATAFAVSAIVTSVGGRSVREWGIDYSAAVTLYVLAAVMMLSMAAVPFTEFYARQGLPREYWGSPRLRAINTRISLVWAGATLSAAISVTAAQLITAHNVGPAAQYLSFALAWPLPILLALAVYRYTDTATAHNGRAVTS